MWGLGSWRRGGWSCRRNCECGGLCVVWSLRWIGMWGDVRRGKVAVAVTIYHLIPTYPHIHIPFPPPAAHSPPINIPFAPSPQTPTSNLKYALSLEDEHKGYIHRNYSYINSSLALGWVFGLSSHFGTPALVLTCLLYKVTCYAHGCCCCSLLELETV